MNYDDQNIVISDDQDNNDVIYDIGDRIFELRDQLSLDIISKNIVDMFEDPKNYETINYVTKFKEKYLELKSANKFDGDEAILNNALQELSQLILTNLNNKFFVGLPNELDDDMIVNIDEFLDQLEVLYNFFIVRRYSNIKDYFKYKLLKNKTMFIEKYKIALDDKTVYDDLFLSQDKKKYEDLADAIIIHFINDIISDIRTETESGFDLFKEIVHTDLYEEYNNKMWDALQNYGNEFVILNDVDSAKAYLSCIDDKEIFVSLRNDLLAALLPDAILSE